MAYLFDPNVLAEIVRLHLKLPVDEQIEAVSRTLKAVYGEHVSPGQPWLWSNAGGIMCSVSPLHVSHNEYVLFAGTAVGSEGHSGRHRADMYDVVMTGELWTYAIGSYERTVHRAGDLACLARGSSNGSKLRPGVWMLEYARGNIASLYPFALGDTLFSTLDTTDLVRMLGVSTKLFLKEGYVRLKERRLKEPFRPKLEHLKRAEDKPQATRRLRKTKRLDLS